MRIATDLLFIAAITRSLQEFSEQSLITQQHFVFAVLVMSLVFGASFKAEDKQRVHIGGFSMASFVREGLSITGLLVFFAFLSQIGATIFFTIFGFAVVVYWMGRAFGLTWILILALVVAWYFGGRNL